jgi:hypothetical protein
MKKCTASIISAKTRAHKRWLAGLSRQLTASNVGVTFLSAQIADLEQRCAAMRRRISCEAAGKNPCAAGADALNVQ